jgi:hypothetical protein
MRFNVPQFIEHEAKIVGPLTFKQFIFIGGAGVLCFVLYYSVPFSIFLAASVILGGAGAALAFLKIGGMSLPSILANFFKFSITPKIYIWKKREQPGIRIYKREEKTSSAKTTEGKEEELPLKIAEKSRLKRLHTQIETKTK